MVPRERMLTVNRRIPLEQLIRLLHETGFTRLPVHDGRPCARHPAQQGSVPRDRAGIVVIQDTLRPVVTSRRISRSDALPFRRGRHLALVRGNDSPILGSARFGTLGRSSDRSRTSTTPTPAGSE
jgi:hypothetical protein